MTRVAVDARWAQGARVGGVGRGLRSLLPRVARDVQIVALADPRRGALALDVPTRWIRLPLPAPAIVWLEVCVPVVLRGFSGTFHSPFNLLPQFCPSPAVVTIHDISFETHRHLFSSGRGALFSQRARRAARLASRIITVSHWSKHEISERYGVADSRVTVVPSGVEASFCPVAAEERPALLSALDRVGLREPYLVAVGGAPRRGAPIAVGAWRELQNRGFPHQPLVLWEAGSDEPGLVRVREASDDAYRFLLAGADLLLYPTETESLGMPALEAAACGTPPVCPPVGALPEVLGEAAMWCAREVGSVADAAASVLSSPTLMAKLAATGRNRGATWTWDAAAQRLLNV